MSLDELQLKKLQVLRDTIKGGDIKKETEKINLSQKNTYYDVVEHLESKPYHMIYDRINQIWLKVEGWLFIKEGYICPLVFNHTYMLRSLHIKNEELILTNDKVGYMFAQIGGYKLNTLQKVKVSISEYNKKMNLAMLEFPRSKQLFDSKAITGFKVL